MTGIKTRWDYLKARDFYDTNKTNYTNGFISFV